MSEFIPTSDQEKGTKIKGLPNTYIVYPSSKTLSALHNMVKPYIPAVNEAVINSFDEYPEAYHNTAYTNESNMLPSHIRIRATDTLPYSSYGTYDAHSYNIPSKMSPQDIYSTIRNDFHKNVGESIASNAYTGNRHDLLFHHLGIPNNLSGMAKLDETKKILGPLWKNFMKHHIKSGAETFDESLPYYSDKEHDRIRDYGPVIRSLFLHNTNLLPKSTRDKLHDYLTSLYYSGDLNGIGLNTKIAEGGGAYYDLNNFLKLLHKQHGHQYKDFEPSEQYPKDPLLSFIKKADTGNLNRNQILEHIMDYLYPMEPY